METLINFDSLEEQSTRLYEIIEELGVSNRGMADALKLPLATFRRFLEGKTAMKPVHQQLLGLYLLIKDTQPDLFNELVPESARDKRFK